MIRVVIVVEGGVVQDVFASEQMELTIVDHDELEETMDSDERDAFGARAVEGLKHVY